MSKACNGFPDLFLNWADKTKSILVLWMSFCKNWISLWFNSANWLDDGYCLEINDEIIKAKTGPNSV